VQNKIDPANASMTLEIPKIWKIVKNFEQWELIGKVKFRNKTTLNFKL
jgi:hypothetical protein